MKNLVMVLLLAGALLGGCGGNGDKPTAPAGGEVGALSKVLVESMTEIFLTTVFSGADSASVAGVQGTVEVEGDNWNFVGYSPDGKLIIDGLLVVEKAKFPEIPAKGTLQLKGSQQGTLVVDMLVKVQDFKVSSVTGTFELNGQIYDVAELIAAGSASG